MLGVVQTADGMPIYHEVFDGNTAEAPTLEPTRVRHQKPSSSDFLAPAPM
jgi:transposase